MRSQPGPAEVHAMPPEALTTHIEFPGWLKAVMHNVYDHAAHHVQPLIPCYRLAAAQKRLNELLGSSAITFDFTFPWLVDTLRRCKVYDYENHRWLDFDGRPTPGLQLSDDTAVPARGASALSA